jgi:hypothetical protein
MFRKELTKVTAILLTESGDIIAVLENFGMSRNWINNKFLGK